MDNPNPLTEIQITGVHAIRNNNYWSKFPVIKVDLKVGKYEDIASDQIPDFIDTLISYIPGISDHGCSYGEPGGFIRRLREGTYIPHILEHVSLELQQILGHDVNFGRARSIGIPNQHCVVYEFLHEAVGIQAAYASLEIIQNCITGSPKNIEEYIIRLEELNLTHIPSRILPKVLCCVLGEDNIETVRDIIIKHEIGMPVVSTSASYLLNSGLPFTDCTVAIILNQEIKSIPPRYTSSINSAELLSLVAETIPEYGCIICPSDAYDLISILEDKSITLKTFEPGNSERERIANAVHTGVDALNQAAKSEANSIRSV